MGKVLVKAHVYHIQINVRDAAVSLPFHGTPREFPDYRPGYYAVFFEDPDRLKLEVAHVPRAWRSH